MGIEDMDEEEVKMLVLDIQKAFPEEFVGILHVCGYANLILALQVPETRLAAISMFQYMPTVYDGDVLVDIANNDPDEATRTAARDAIKRRENPF